MSFVLNNELKAKGVSSVLVFLKEGTQREDAEKVLDHFALSELSQRGALAAAGAGKGAVPPGRYYPNLGVMLGVVARDAVAALKADSRVRDIAGAPTLRLIRPVASAAATLKKTRTWGIDALSVPKLWAQGLDGSKVKVAHLDTGVDGKHPALKKAVADFAEFDLFGREVKPKPKPWDSDEHGTHTAGTIAGRAVSGRSIGVAPGAELHAAMVIEQGDVVARVLGGMDWAVGQGAKILSMSLGFPGYVGDFLRITQILRQRGVLPIMAVGNEGPGTSRSPGNYAEALSVGAIDSKGRIARFSSSDRFRRKKDPLVPDLVAPGVDTISAAPGGGYQSMSGTSMATPHVAGLAALLWQAKPGASVAQVEKAILVSCRPIPGVSRERQGRGIPDAVAALAAL